MENSEDRVDATTAPAAGVEQLQGSSSAKKGSETTAVKATVPPSKMVRANTAIGMSSLSQAKQNSMVVLQQPNCSANVIDDNRDGSGSGAAANSANLRLQPSKSGVELNRIGRLK